MNRLRKLGTGGALLIGALLLVLVLAVFWLEAVVRMGVERVGSAHAKVAVTLKGVRLSLVGGRVVLDSLTVANPAGYQAPTAITVRSIAAQLDWMSLTTPRVVLPEVVVDAPDITFEGSPSGNNLQVIRKNLLAAVNASPASAGSASRGSRALVIKRLRIVDARVSVRLRAGTLETAVDGIRLKPITLENLGDPDHPLSTADVAARVFGALTREAVGTVGTATGSLIGESAKETGKTMERAVDGLRQLFSR